MTTMTLERPLVGHIHNVPVYTDPALPPGMVAGLTRDGTSITAVVPVGADLAEARLVLVPLIPGGVGR